jgi:hypothetical protein
MATACNISASWLALAVASYSANEDHAEKRAGYRQALRLLILYVLFLCLAAPITPATVLHRTAQ